MTDTKVVHPIFMKCLDYILDPFWKTMFVSLANGKYPRGVRVANNVLTVRTKDTPFGIDSVNLEKADPKSVYLSVCSLLKMNLKISSSLDKKKQKMKLDDIRCDLEKMYEGTWSQINSRTVRQELIEKYILSLRDKYKLTLHETNRIYSFVNLAFLFKRYTSKDVVYENGSILSIGDLEDMVRKGETSLDISFQGCEDIKENIKENMMCISSDTKINLVDKWEPYLERHIKNSCII